MMTRIVCFIPRLGELVTQRRDKARSNFRKRSPFLGMTAVFPKHPIIQEPLCRRNGQSGPAALLGGHGICPETQGEARAGPHGLPPMQLSSVSDGRGGSAFPSPRTVQHGTLGNLRSCNEPHNVLRGG